MDEFLNEMKSFQKKMNNLFKDFFNGKDLLPLAGNEKGYLTPRSDLIEKKDKLVAVMDMPGLEKDDIIVSITPSGVEVHAEKKEKKKEDGEVKRLERRYTGYSRFFSLPEGVNPEEVKAKYKNGVLKITIPKKKSKKSEKKKIKVE